MKRQSRVLLGLVLVSGLGLAGLERASAAPPPGTDVAALQRIAAAERARYAAGRGPLYHKLLASGKSGAAALNVSPEVQLMYVDARGMPVYFGTDNANAAATIGTDAVHCRYEQSGRAWSHKLTGFMWDQLGMWDNGAVYVEHTEFCMGSGGVVQVDISTDDPVIHATHVAGTLVSEGYLMPESRGMAFEAMLDAYDWEYDVAEMAAAAAEGMLASNHSYGIKCGFEWEDVELVWYWHGDVEVANQEDYKFGAYLPVTATWDSLARAAPNYLICKSAGNDRGEGPLPYETYYYFNPLLGDWDITGAYRPSDGNDGYDCIPPRGNAKNVITVGAVQDLPGGYQGVSSVVLCPFSSCGPTDDGRVKPDLVANGDVLYSTTTEDDGYYTTKSGTSMAAPSVTGSIALLQQHYRFTYGRDALSSTIKALLIATADEAGRPGPDYEYGWGLMNTLRAADFISDVGQIRRLSDDLPANYLLEDSLATGEEDHYLFWRASAARPLIVTLAWTDPPGPAAGAELDPTELRLVHDLDLRVFQGDSQYLPYVLDPAEPESDAVTGDNVRDNVEKIVVAGAEGIVRVVVRHKGELTDLQGYSLAVDNVTICVWPRDVCGPFIGPLAPVQSQDGFPERGQLDPFDLGVNWGRFDAAWPHRMFFPKSTTAAGDSICFDVVPADPAAGLTGLPRLHYLLQPNPLFDPYRSSGLPLSGWVEGDSVRTDGGGTHPDRFCFDLPDTSFLFPGDVLHFYIEASDDLHGTACLPVDLSAFADFTAGSPYPDDFTLRILPSVASAALEQPGILLWIDADTKAGWRLALDNLGFVQGLDYDVYRTTAPWFGLGNGLGGRATPDLLDGYQTVLYSCGELDSYTLSPGDPGGDPGDDLGLLDAWLAAGERNLLLTGDKLAGDLTTSGPGSSFLADWISAVYVAGDVGPLVGGQISPRIAAVSGTPVFGDDLEWYALGGILNPRTFDAVEAAGGALRVAEYLDPEGFPVGTSLAAATYHHDPGLDNRIVFLPYDLCHVVSPTDPAHAPSGIATRALVLAEILACFGHFPSGAPTSVGAAVPLTASARPNPFNPSTRIEYLMPGRGPLEIGVFDLRGRRVRTLHEGIAEAGPGHVTWRGRDDAGAGVAAGVYIYRIRAAGKQLTGKVVLVK